MSLSVKRSAFVSVLFIVVSFLAITIFQQQMFIRRTQSAINDFNYRFGQYRAIYYAGLNANEGDSPQAEVNQQLRGLQSTTSFLSFFNIATLYMRGQENLIDPFNYIHPPFNLERFWLDTDIIGYLSIPAIGLELPVFLGTSPHNLNRGLAHLTHSSFPVGGESTHTVIAGHRHLHNARVFRGIESLDVGDEILFTNFYRTLVYEVVGSQIIHPSQTDALLIRSNMDLISLVTQYSVGFNRNRYRIVVTASRVGY